MDPKELEKLKQMRDKNLQEFQKRKRLCNSMIDAIMEGYLKSKQKLIEDTEIETDEAAGFDINQYKWTILVSRAVLKTLLEVGNKLTLEHWKQN